MAIHCALVTLYGLNLRSKASANILALRLVMKARQSSKLNVLTTHFFQGWLYISIL